MAHRASALLALTLLVVQPALVLAAREAGPECPPAARFVPAGTVVLFDEAHFPVYTVNPDNPSGYVAGNQPRGAYRAFADQLVNAGMTVKTLDYGYYLDSEHLAGVKVLVIVCSQGQDRPDPDATVFAPYTAEETEAVLKFVRNGGGLFLIGDHTTFPPAIFPVAEKFGVVYAQQKLQDPFHNVHNDTTIPPMPLEEDSDRYSFIFFERNRGNFAVHPIMANISRVELYRTDYFSELPDEAVPLITTDTDTYYYNGMDDPEHYAPSKVVSAAIPSNTTAGAGRVVVVADTNTFETDENRDTDDDLDLYDSDNELYGLQAAEWLADVPVHIAVDVRSAEPGSAGAHAITHNLTAGATTTFRLRLENAGNVPDVYDLTAVPDRPGWAYGLGFSEAELRNSETRELNLTVRAPADARVGDDCAFTVLARSRLDPLTNGSMECRAVVPAVHELALGCPKNRLTIETGQGARYELRLQNRGNVRERVQAGAEQPFGWGAELDAGFFELDPGRLAYFNLTVTPPPGALGGAEAPVAVVARSLDDSSVTATNVTYTRLLQRYAIGLSCPFPELSVDPGSLASFPVSVTNLGNGDDEVTLSLIGGSRWATYLEPSFIELPFNSTVEAALVARAPPGSAANETQALTVLAYSVRDSKAQDRLGLRATVNRMAKFTLAVDPPVVYADPGGAGAFNVTLTNTGNTNERVLLAAGEPGVLSAPETVVSMGQSSSAGLSVPVSPDARAWTEVAVVVEGASAQEPEVSRHAIATVVVNQLFKIRGELLPAVLPVTPGANGTTILRVWNEGNGADVVSCSIEGAPPGWAASALTQLLDIDYLGYGSGAITVNVPPGAPAGTVNLTVTLADGAGQAQSLVLQVNVIRVHNFTAAVMPETASALPGKRVAFTLVLGNLGNSAEILDVAPGGKRASWVVPDERAALVNRSSGRDIVLHVRSDQDTRPGSYLLNVTVTGEDGKVRQVSFHLRVREGPTTQNELPCWIGLLVVLAASGAALVVRQRMIRAQREAELEGRPAEKIGDEK